MNKRGNYNNTPTERGCCHQPEPVLFSSPEKIRTGNENDPVILTDIFDAVLRHLYLWDLLWTNDTPWKDVYDPFGL